MFCVILGSGAICLFGAIYQSEFDLKFRIEKSIFIFSWSNLPSWSNLSRCNLQTSTVDLRLFIRPGPDWAEGLISSRFKCEFGLPSLFIPSNSPLLLGVFDGFLLHPQTLPFPDRIH